MLRKIRSEQGSSDIVTTLFLLPLAVFLIFTMIELSFYFSTRSLVQNTIQDATRQAASWGGNNTRLNTLGTPVNSAADTSIRSSSLGARISNLNVTCAVNGNVYGIANRPGQQVSCRAQYNYNGVTGGAANFFGFGFVDQEIDINGYSRSVVGFGG